VNAKNNVSKLYTEAQAEPIVEAALDGRRRRSICAGSSNKTGDGLLLAEGPWFGISV